MDGNLVKSCYNINDQFDFVNTKLLEYINICAPIKVDKIPAKYVIRENWMRNGLPQSSLNLQNMRKRETGKTNSNLYKSYRNLYNRLVRIVKTMHCTSLIDRYKGDVAKTWQVLNDITGKRKKVNFVILSTLIVYRIMMPMTSVMHFVVILLILDSNVPQR